MSLLFLPLLSACALVSDADLAARLDLDGDGVQRPDDCDDADASAGLPTEWLVDEDGDGYGGTGTITACAAGGQVASVGGDCDDSNGSAYPGAIETCDGVDEDCDGQVDEDVTPTWYIDADEDGYGSDASTRSDCEQPSGFVANAEDCDDTRADLNPTTPWYADADADGYGNAASTTVSCSQPAGFVANLDDCDDTRGDVSPGGVEICDVDDADGALTCWGGDLAPPSGGVPIRQRQRRQHARLRDRHVRRDRLLGLHRGRRHHDVTILRD